MKTLLLLATLSQAPMVEVYIQGTADRDRAEPMARWLAAQAKQAGFSRIVARMEWGVPGAVWSGGTLVVRTNRSLIFPSREIVAALRSGAAELQARQSHHDEERQPSESRGEIQEPTARTLVLYTAPG